MHPLRCRHGDVEFDRDAEESRCLWVPFPVVPQTDPVGRRLPDRGRAVGEDGCQVVECTGTARLEQKVAPAGTGSGGARPACSVRMSRPVLVKNSADTKPGTSLTAWRARLWSSSRLARPTIAVTRFRGREPAAAEPW